LAGVETVTAMEAFPFVTVFVPSSRAPVQSKTKSVIP
jgi:hypothetical protein